MTACMTAHAANASRSFRMLLTIRTYRIIVLGSRIGRRQKHQRALASKYVVWYLPLREEVLTRAAALAEMYQIQDGVLAVISTL